ncbi:hypothetical protein B0H17DRAFT_503763 [Mycena rosella]|uniref:Uncharacterized protein n=1 Tax=Mycena rosella TaxID=1033263 RepID=A0AAD7C0W0_MYCRO|nr:hypothetical protein B0H17DRAFT_503763 [Mycena rosella]
MRGRERMRPTSCRGPVSLRDACGVVSAVRGESLVAGVAVTSLLASPSYPPSSDPRPPALAATHPPHFAPSFTYLPTFSPPPTHRASFPSFLAPYPSAPPRPHPFPARILPGRPHLASLTFPRLFPVPSSPITRFLRRRLLCFFLMYPPSSAFHPGCLLPPCPVRPPAPQPAFLVHPTIGCSCARVLSHSAELEAHDNGRGYLLTRHCIRIPRDVCSEGQEGAEASGGLSSFIWSAHPAVAASASCSQLSAYPAFAGTRVSLRPRLPLVPPPIRLPLHLLAYYASSLSCPAPPIPFSWLVMPLPILCLPPLCPRPLQPVLQPQYDRTLPAPAPSPPYTSFHRLLLLLVLRVPSYPAIHVHSFTPLATLLLLAFSLCPRLSYPVLSPSFGMPISH